MYKKFTMISEKINLLIIIIISCTHLIIITIKNSKLKTCVTSTHIVIMYFTLKLHLNYNKIRETIEKFYILKKKN